MTSEQYEEICRLFIAEQEGFRPDQVRSVRLPNPVRPGLPQYAHQIDLYWETGSSIAAYLNIANVKWRRTDKVDQGDVLLLQQVRSKVAAHKAFVITNVGFTAGALAAAKDEGIALHVLAPDPDLPALLGGDRAGIQAQLAQMAGRQGSLLWTHRTEHRGLGFGSSAAPTARAPRPATTPQVFHQTRVVPPMHVPAPPTTTRAPGPMQTRDGSAQRDSGSGYGTPRPR